MSNAIKRAYADVPHGQLHFLEAGAGPVLLLLHAVPRSARLFRNLLPVLAPHFRAIALDLPGFGQSDPLPGEVAVEGLAQVVVDLLDSLGITKASVFGIHTGNKVAAAMAAAHGERLDRLILCGQIHSIIPEKRGRDDAIRRIVAKYFAQYPVSPNGEQHLRRWLAEWADVTAFALPRNLYTAAPLQESDIADAQVRVLDHMQALASVAATYGANFTFDLEAAMRRIAIPTLVLELVMPHEEHYGRQLDAVCACIAGSRGATIENADGTVVETRPLEVAGYIVDFLAAQ